MPEEHKFYIEAGIVEETKDLAAKLKGQPYEVQYAMIMQLVDVMDEEDQYLLGAGIVMDLCDIDDEEYTGEDFKARTTGEAMMYG